MAKFRFDLTVPCEIELPEHIGSVNKAYGEIHNMSVFHLLTLVNVDDPYSGEHTVENIELADGGDEDSEGEDEDAEQSDLNYYGSDPVEEDEDE